MVIGNENLIMARLDPVRLNLVGKLRRKREKDADLVRRAIDALAEREKACETNGNNNQKT